MVAHCFGGLFKVFNDSHISKKGGPQAHWIFSNLRVAIRGQD